MCCRCVINPTSFLTKTERGSLEQGRLQRSTAERLCEPEPNANILVDIMERFDLLIPYEAEPQRSEARAQEYLVPCMMKRVPGEHVRSKFENVPILHFKFVQRDYLAQGKEEEGIFLPHGLFHRVVSHCCRTNKKRILIATYYDYMELSTDKGIVFYLRMAYDSILLCATKIDTSYETQDQRCEALNNLREEVQSSIDAIVNTAFPNLTCVHYLECISQGHTHR